MVHLNNKGEIRLSEQLTNSDAYIKHYPERMNMMTTELLALSQFEKHKLDEPNFGDSPKKKSA